MDWSAVVMNSKQWNQNFVCHIGGLQSGHKEVVEKIYRWREGALPQLLQLGLEFATFNGGVKVCPMQKNDPQVEREETSTPDDADGEVMIRVHITTHQPNETSPPVVIHESGTLNGGHLGLTASCPPNSNFGGMSYAASLYIEISEKLCEYTTLGLQSSNGGICIQKGLRFKDVTCKTSNGKVDVQADCTGLMYLTTSNGRIVVYSQILPTSTRLRTSNGSIVATLPPPLPSQSLQFNLSTSNGKVQTTMKHRVISKRKKVELYGICESQLGGVSEKPLNVSLTTSNGNVNLLDLLKETN